MQSIHQSEASRDAAVARKSLVHMVQQTWPSARSDKLKSDGVVAGGLRIWLPRPSCFGLNFEIVLSKQVDCLRQKQLHDLQCGHHPGRWTAGRCARS